MQQNEPAAVHEGGVANADAPIRNNNNRGGRGNNRRGGRGRGGNNNRRPPANDNLQPPPRPNPPVVPKPQHLSKTASPIQKDPLYLEAFVVEGDKGFVEQPGLNNFTVSADSYIGLVERTYVAVCGVDKEFQRHISLSMYSWYNVLHYHRRVGEIRAQAGRASEDERQYIRFMTSAEFPVHEPIAHYLRGIGNFTDPSGTPHLYVQRMIPQIAEFDGVAGFYGPVTPATHTIYESYPAPGVSALRLLHDLHYTQDPHHDQIWNLPEALRPPPFEAAVQELNEEQDDGLQDEGDDPALVAGVEPAQEEEEEDPAAEPVRRRVTPLPTANLLGWGRATRLTNEQRQTLETSGLTIEEGFAADMPRFTLNEALFQFIAGRVKSTVGVKVIDSLDIAAKEGSIAQTCYLEKELTPRAFNRMARYCEGGVRGASAYQLEHRIAVAVRVVGYRVRKEATVIDQDEEHRTYACYDFLNYTQVPDAWHETRNSTFEYGNVAALNIATKFTTYSEKERLRGIFIETSVKRSTR